MKTQVEFMDRDFLDNKIEVGDKVIFEAPKYRDFVIGTVITKAPKSCQIEYINDWNYHRDMDVIEVVRQYYGQIIKYPIVKEGVWESVEEEAFWIQNMEESLKTGKPTIAIMPRCSCCKEVFGRVAFEYKYCPNCGSKMLEE